MPDIKIPQAKRLRAPDPGGVYVVAASPETHIPLITPADTTDVPLIPVTGDGERVQIFLPEPDEDDAQ